MGSDPSQEASETCPVCDESLDVSGGQLHWNRHVFPLPGLTPGAGSGLFTWHCRCGPSGMKWVKPRQAMAGLALHLEERHGVPLLYDRFLFDGVAPGQNSR